MICKCCLKIDKDELLDGIKSVTDLEQLYKIIINKELRELHITKEFAETYFTPLGLNEFIKSLRKMNNFITIKVDESYIERENNLEEILGKCSNYEELLTVILNNRDLSLRAVKNLYAKAHRSKVNELQFSNKFNTYATTIMREKSKVRNMEIDYYHLQREYIETRTKLDIISARIKHTYNLSFDEQSILNIDEVESRFKHIIYFKEITRVKFVDTLIYYLKELLASYYHEAVRSVVIEGRDCIGRNLLYPGHKVNIELNIQDVMNSDIYMNGFQSKLMSDILKNPLNRNFLIILDRGYHSRVHINARNMTTIYISSELSDLKVHTDMNKIISYDENTLHIPYIEDFSNKSSEERIRNYSSLPIVETLLEYIEVGEYDEKRY